MPSIEVEGKPRLFFSDNSPDKSWRMTEKVAAVVESYFRGRDDLYVYSSRKVKNIVGDTEEVDVAFADVSDPTTSFDFVQIRDRENTEGRPWVEQILGQRNSLELNAGIMVSTQGFSEPAIKLAKNKNIPLRLLLPETDQNIKLWYKSDTIGRMTPLVHIEKCLILAKVGDKIREFKADQSKSLENNILFPTDEADIYNVISLGRVFDVDVMQNSTRNKDLLDKIPEDESFHNAIAGITYHHPRLYLKVNSIDVNGSTNTNGIVPIQAIIFFISANRQLINSPIIYRYKYVDAINNNVIAQAILTEFDFDKTRYYICLVRHHIVGDNINIGGAFFR
jgi:hypothetical protein